MEKEIVYKIPVTEKPEEGAYYTNAGFLSFDGKSWLDVNQDDVSWKVDFYILPAKDLSLVESAWISVNEYMPDSGDKVLIWAPRYDMLVSAEYRGGAFIHNGSRYRAKDEVTRWKPRPSPPVD